MPSEKKHEACIYLTYSANDDAFEYTCISLPWKMVNLLWLRNAQKYCQSQQFLGNMLYCLECYMFRLIHKPSSGTGKKYISKKALICNMWQHELHVRAHFSYIFILCLMIACE